VRTALVTGVNGGIGSALTEAFIEEGYRVIGLDLQASPEVVCDEYVQCDLERCASEEQYLTSKSTQVDALLGGDGLHVLVNNAALQLLKPTESIGTDDWQKVLGINVVAPFLLVRSFLTQLESVGGSVVNISSIHGQLTKPGFVPYAVSKSALDGLTRALAVDLGPRVRVNAVAPAATATPMLLDGFSGHPELLDELAEVHPLGRIAQPHEIANVVVFLASAAAGFISGAVVAVDAGIGGRLHDPT
jgi:NAD(P)-dependent dehydrogenase (short-subunit alcohol dehydrogenase family)